jgi:hypothetical protein
MIAEPDDAVFELEPTRASGFLMPVPAYIR